MIDVRCKGCSKLLMKANLLVAAIKCPGCKKIFEYKVFTNLHMTNSVDPTAFYDTMNPEATEPRPE